MKRPILKNHLLKTNIFITILIVIINCVIYSVTGFDKDLFILFNWYADGFLFFIYLFIFSALMKKDIIQLKKEAYYLNYPLYTWIFLILIFTILLASGIYLMAVNKEAVNAASIFIFFMVTLAMLFPSVLLIVFMYLLMPAFIIPGLNIHKKRKSNNILKILFICFVIFFIWNMVTLGVRKTNYETQKKYKSSKLAINYSTKYLKLSDDINSYTKKKLTNITVTIPFFYTSDSFPYSTYKEAEIFCGALDARLPDYNEAYHIVFNKFDTFGDKYYWTNNFDGNKPLVLHFKNMSYELIKKPEGVVPYLYCVDKDSASYGYKNKTYFYRNIVKENFDTIDNLVQKQFNNNLLTDILKDFQAEKEIEQQSLENDNINNEKKHVNFSVKEVSPEYFNQLIKAGYAYNQNSTVDKKYETNESIFNSRIQRHSHNIRLCYYPFVDYGNMSINSEMQIWRQSFCSPAFDLIEPEPALKSKYEKDAYCYSRGGKLPNIPELAAILKTKRINTIGVKYWTDNSIQEEYSNNQNPVLAYYSDSRFMKVQALSVNEDERAYAFCIKNPQNPSIVITNYQSRFRGENGEYYAKLQCPDCYYYEVPDTIVMK